MDLCVADDAVEPASSSIRKRLSSAEVFHATVWADERLDGSVDDGHVASGFMRPHTNQHPIKKSTGAWRRPDWVICVPLAPTANRPLQAQLLRRQRRHWHRYLAFERPLSGPKGAAYRHISDVDLQSADSIKFVFSGASHPIRATSRHHQANRGTRRPGRHCTDGPSFCLNHWRRPARPR